MSFYIHDPKHRLISVAPFHRRPSRLFCNVIEPIRATASSCRIAVLRAIAAHGALPTTLTPPKF